MTCPTGQWSRLVVHPTKQAVLHTPQPPHVEVGIHFRNPTCGMPKTVFCLLSFFQNRIPQETPRPHPPSPTPTHPTHPHPRPPPPPPPPPPPTPTHPHPQPHPGRLPGGVGLQPGAGDRRQLRGALGLRHGRGGPGDAEELRRRQAAGPSWGRGGEGGGRGGKGGREGGEGREGGGEEEGGGGGGGSEHGLCLKFCLFAELVVSKGFVVGLDLFVFFLGKSMSVVLVLFLKTSV